MHFNLEKRVPPAELLFKNYLEDQQQYCILKDPYIRTFINIVYTKCVMCCVGSSAALRSIMSAASGLGLWETKLSNGMGSEGLHLSSVGRAGEYQGSHTVQLWGEWFQRSCCLEGKYRHSCFSSNHKLLKNPKPQK